jgi:hypothetical protein
MVRTIRDVVVNFKSNVGQFVSGIRTADAGLKKFNSEIQRLQKEGIKSVGTMQKLGIRVRQVSQTFQASSLSILFFGMAIQRVFTRIARSSTTAYREISESAGGAAVGIDALEAGVKFLSFTMGDAINTFIRPFIPMIFNVVNAIAQWVNNNQKLVSIITLVGIAVGGLLLVIGTLSLGITNGLLPIFTSLLGFLGGEGILAAFGLIGVALGILVAAWITNFGNIRDFVGTMVKSIINIFGGAIDILIGIVNADGSLIINGFRRVFKGITDIVDAFGLFIGNTFIDIVRFIITGPIRFFKKLGEIIRSVLINGLGISEDSALIRFIDFLVEKLGIAIDFVSRLADKIKEFSSKITGEGGIASLITGGGLIGKIGDLLGFANGGVVPGPIGAPQLAVVHGGETVTPPGGMGGGGSTFNITINTTGGINPQELVREIKRHMRA